MDGVYSKMDSPIYSYFKFKKIPRERMDTILNWAKITKYEVLIPAAESNEEYIVGAVPNQEDVDNIAEYLSPHAIDVTPSTMDEFLELKSKTREYSFIRKDLEL